MTDFKVKNFSLKKTKQSTIDELIPCIFTFLDGNLNPNYGSNANSNMKFIKHNIYKDNDIIYSVGEKFIYGLSNRSVLNLPEFKEKSEIYISNKEHNKNDSIFPKIFDFGYLHNSTDLSLINTYFNNINYDKMNNEYSEFDEDEKKP